jgi:hypothetical protein
MQDDIFEKIIYAQYGAEILEVNFDLTRWIGSLLSCVCDVRNGYWSCTVKIWERHVSDRTYFMMSFSFFRSTGNKVL